MAVDLRAGDLPPDELDRALMQKNVYLIAYTLRGEHRDHESVKRVIKHIAENDGDVVNIDGSIWAIRTHHTAGQIQNSLLGQIIREGDLLFVIRLPLGHDWNIIGATGEGRDALAREVLDTWLRRSP